MIVLSIKWSLLSPLEISVRSALWRFRLGCLGPFLGFVHFRIGSLVRFDGLDQGESREGAEDHDSRLDGYKVAIHLIVE